MVPLGPIDAHLSGRLVRLLATVVDAAVIIDEQGRVAEAATSIAALPADFFSGRPFSDLVTIESRGTVANLLAQAPDGPLPRKLEIKHRLPNGSEIALLYSVFRCAETGVTVAAGRDLSSVALLQQRLVESQRIAEGHFLRLRTADVRYRVLFHLSGEAIVLADAVSLKILDVNPAAAELFNATPGRLLGRRAGEVFDPESQSRVDAQIETVRVTGKAEAARAKLADGRQCWLSAVLFRDADAGQILLRIAPAEARADTAPGVKSKILRLVDEMPDAFVIVDADRRVLDANPAFLNLLDVASLAQARGQEIDRWLGRTGVEADILFNNLRDHKSVRGFMGNVRSEHGAIEDVLITAVALEENERPLYGLVISPEARRAKGSQAGAETSRSAEELAELVGRVPLKELVRETTEITERLCIEASLRLTGDNRAAAAQMLGLSRQGLYDKLRRYDMIDAAHRG